MRKICISISLIHEFPIKTNNIYIYRFLMKFYKKKQQSSKSSRHHKTSSKRISQKCHLNAIQIGYYPIRGKAQVPRLIMEYLKVPYIDKLFELEEWDQFKREKCQNWDCTDLPFIIDRNPLRNATDQNPVIITQAFPICTYIIQKSGRNDLLGKTSEDKSILQMYLWTIQTMGSIININCNHKSPEETLENFKQRQWKNNVLPRMNKYQNYVKNSLQEQNGWFLGYLTIIDFSIYELIGYMNLLFPGNESSLPKLNRISRDILNLPEIWEYENSQRCIKQMDPNTLLQKLKNKRT